jgi:hypothetical protein
MKTPLLILFSLIGVSQAAAGNFSYEKHGDDWPSIKYTDGTINSCAGSNQSPIDLTWKVTHEQQDPGYFSELYKNTVN